MAGQVSLSGDQNDVREENDEQFLSQYLPFLLFRSYQLLSREFHDSMSTLGLDVTECRILSCLADFGPQSLQEIQCRAQLVQTTASRACLRLEQQALVNRTVGELDKRSRIFELTPTGRSTSCELMRLSRSALESTLERTTVDPETLTAVLNHLVADLESTPPPH